MLSGQSVLGISAAGLYAFVLLACIGACIVAASAKQPPAHAWLWALIALVFAGLFSLRAFGLEEALRQDFRTWLRSEGIYQNRRDLQRPIASVVVLLATPAIFMMVYLMARNRASRRNMVVGLGVLGAGAMLVLVVFRVISLHPIDRLLYGPLKLNWLTDIGSSVMVLGASLGYVWLVRRRSPTMR